MIWKNTNKALYSSIFFYKYKNYPIMKPANQQTSKPANQQKNKRKIAAYPPCTDLSMTMRHENGAI